MDTYISYPGTHGVISHSIPRQTGSLPGGSQIYYNLSANCEELFDRRTQKPAKNRLGVLSYSASSSADPSVRSFKIKLSQTRNMERLFKGMVCEIAGVAFVAFISFNLSRLFFLSPPDGSFSPGFNQIVFVCIPTATYISFRAYTRVITVSPANKNVTRCAACSMIQLCTGSLIIV